MAERSALLTSDQEVLVSNQARGSIYSFHDCMALSCTELFIINLPLSQYDLSIC